jgi:hypothetical protein
LYVLKFLPFSLDVITPDLKVMLYIPRPNPNHLHVLKIFPFSLNPNNPVVILRFAILTPEQLSR